VQEYDTKAAADCRYEAHKNYIDIQYIVSGAEIINAFEISKGTESDEYNQVKDVVHYNPVCGAVSGLLTAGEFGIYMPHDVHMPQIAKDDKPSAVKKIVVKVRV